MTEQEELQQAEAAALRQIKQLERQQAVQDIEQQQDALQLRIIEAKALLDEKPAMNIVVYRNGDSVAVIDSVNQELIVEVLERILQEDRDKLSQL